MISIRRTWCLWLAVVVLALPAGPVGASSIPLQKSAPEEHLAPTLKPVAIARQASTQERALAVEPGKTFSLEQQLKSAEGARWDNFWRDPTVTFNFLLVILTAALAFVAFRQVNSVHVARLTLDAAKQASRDQLRAYVHAEKATVNWFDTGLEAILTITNTGATPATFFEISGTADFQQMGAETRIPPMDHGPVWSALGGGVSTTAPLRVEGVSYDDLSRTQDNYLSLRGTIRYGTIFGETVESEFDFLLKHRRGDEAQKMQRSTGKHRVYHRVD